MKVVDMRVRPPLPSLMRSVLFQSKDGVEQTRHPDYPRPESAKAGSISLLLQEMDDAEVQHAVIMGRHSMEPFGVIPNDEIAQFVANYPDRFVAWAGVDLSKGPEDWIREIRRCSTLSCFKGISVEPSISLDPTIRLANDRRLYPIYEECLRLTIPVNITLSGVLQRITREPYENSSPLQVYQVALDFPKLDIHVAHAAYPWVMEMIGIAFTCTNVWLSPDLYMVKQMPGGAEYAKAANNYFQARTVFGSNYPSKPFPQMINGYREWGWRPGVIDAVLGGNALRLMRMD